MTKTTSWTPKVAKATFAKLTKVAAELLDVAAEAPAPSPEQEQAGTAGPQEVVDALDVIVSELEEVQAVIPAEPSADTGEPQPDQAPQEQPQIEADPVADPVDDNPDPTDEPKLAKAFSKIADLEKKLEKQDLEKVAQNYGELFEDTRTQQAKFDEVIASKNGSGYWIAKIEAITEFKENAGDNSSNYKPAKNTTSWIQPRSKFAKQVSNELTRL